MYEYTSDGDKYASDVTTCYFCAATFSATIGGYSVKFRVLSLKAIVMKHIDVRSNLRFLIVERLLSSKKKNYILVLSGRKEVAFTSKLFVSGGIGTLVGTGTNLVFKGLFHE